MNTLYGNKPEVQRDFVYRNDTQFAYVGVDERTPDHIIAAGAVALGSTGVCIPPGQAVKRTGGVLPFIQSNGGAFTVLHYGPEAEARKELEALKRRGITGPGGRPLSPETVLVATGGKDEKGEPVKEPFLKTFISGVHAMISDVTDDAEAVSKAVMAGASDNGKIAKELADERAKRVAVEAELARLKEEKAKKLAK